MPSRLEQETQHQPFNANDVVMYLARERFVSGELPYMQTLIQDFAEPPGSVTGGVLRRRADSRWSATYSWFSGPGWDLYLNADTTDFSARVFAETPEIAQSVVDELISNSVKLHISDTAVQMGFWTATANGIVRSTRSLEVHDWEDVEQNYSSACNAGLRDLMKAPTPNVNDGRLVLFHGPPGTGKTTALRALAKEWKSWCQVDVIVDPERMFNDGSYLTGVMLDGALGDNWRLIVLEDCDELIREGANGPALSRMLNVADGLLGQGQKLLIALTTNRPLSSLHPAVTRAGRCMAEIEVGPLPADEASAWLGEPVSKPMVLADMYAKKHGGETNRAVTEKNNKQTGMYL